MFARCYSGRLVGDSGMNLLRWSLGLPY